MLGLWVLLGRGVILKHCIHLEITLLVAEQPCTLYLRSHEGRYIYRGLSSKVQHTQDTLGDDHRGEA